MLVEYLSNIETLPKIQVCDLVCFFHLNPVLLLLFCSFGVLHYHNFFSKTQSILAWGKADTEWLRIHHLEFSAFSKIKEYDTGKAVFSTRLSRVVSVDFFYKFCFSVVAFFLCINVARELQFGNKTWIYREMWGPSKWRCNLNKVCNHCLLTSIRFEINAKC